MRHFTCPMTILPFLLPLAAAAPAAGHRKGVRGGGGASFPAPNSTHRFRRRTYEAMCDSWRKCSHHPLADNKTRLDWKDDSGFDYKRLQYMSPSPINYLCKTIPLDRSDVIP